MPQQARFDILYYRCIFRCFSLFTALPITFSIPLTSQDVRDVFVPEYTEEGNCQPAVSLCITVNTG